ALNDGKDTSATVSKSVIQTLLREQLGYDGLVISDALNMHSVSKLYKQKGQLEWEAFNAGNDVLCFAENVPEGIQEILKKATPDRIEASFNRLWKCKEKAGIVNGKLRLPKLSQSGFDFKTTAALNLKIAQNAITKIKDNHNTVTVFDAKNREDLAKLSLYKNTDNTFFKSLATALPSPEFCYGTGSDLTIKELEEALIRFDTIIVSLFVPKAKPLNNFDIEQETLQFLGNLFQTKKCILYVFGNPYALQVLPNLKHALGIVQMYQDFAEFQETAAEQLLENTYCKGTLPVTVSVI
ncbi:MAG TPA: glycoside hydrolase family 3 N-terminal domain-containing protein, partial [Flavobacterium sp.]